MEDRFDLRLQPPGHHRLGDSVRDRRHARASSSHRRAVSVSPPPSPEAESSDPEDIRFQILYRLFFRSFSNSSIVTHPPPAHPDSPSPSRYASHTSRFEISNDLPDDFSLSTATPPGPTLRLIDRTQPQMTRPLGSTPTAPAGASPLLRAGPPARPATVLSPSRFQPLGRLPLATHRPAVSRHAFPRSVREQQTRLTSPTCRTPPGQYSGHPPGSSRD